MPIQVSYPGVYVQEVAGCSRAARSPSVICSYAYSSLFRFQAILLRRPSESKRLFCERKYLPELAPEVNPWFQYFAKKAKVLLQLLALIGSRGLRL